MYCLLFFSLSARNNCVLNNLENSIQLFVTSDDDDDDDDDGGDDNLVDDKYYSNVKEEMQSISMNKLKGTFSIDDSETSSYDKINGKVSINKFSTVEMIKNKQFDIVIGTLYDLCWLDMLSYIHVHCCSV